MKKLLSLVLALMMVLGCAAMAEDVTGTWYADMFGMPVTLEVNEDGKQQRKQLEIDFVCNKGSSRYYIQYGNL